MFRLPKLMLSAGLLSLLMTGCTATTTAELVAPVGGDVADGNNVIENTDDALVLGDISDEPTETIAAFQPLADYLAAEQGRRHGIVAVAPDMETMAAWLASGQVDVYFDSPYPAMVVSELSGAQPVLRSWKGGQVTYYSVIFTRADSAIQSVEDLQGGTLAFEVPTSTSGYMLPLGYLVESGLRLVETQVGEAQVPADAIGYVFSESDRNSIQWVLAQRVDAAAVGVPDFREIPASVREQLRILAKTEVLPRQLVVVSPTLTPTEVEAITATLFRDGRDRYGAGNPGHLSGADPV
jgi:phosphonate transport system substrate-binding protein